MKTYKWTEENELRKKWILHEQTDLQKQYQAEALGKKPQMNRNKRKQMCGGMEEKEEKELTENEYNSM